MACTICLIRYAERPWKSMQIYKTNSTVKTICNDLLLKLFWGDPNITYRFVQRVWPLQRRWSLFLQIALLWESAGSMSKSLYHELRVGCLQLSHATRSVPAACCCLNCERDVSLRLVRVAGLNSRRVVRNFYHCK